MLNSSSSVKHPDWAAGHDQSQNGVGGGGGWKENSAAMTTHLLTVHLLVFPYTAPHGDMRKADDVKPGLICPHQEQNCHHLPGP